MLWEKARTGSIIIVSFCYLWPSGEGNQQNGMTEEIPNGVDIFITIEECNERYGAGIMCFSSTSFDLFLARSNTSYVFHPVAGLDHDVVRLNVCI